MIYTLHRVSAGILGAFIVVHLFNHLLSVSSIAAHITFMESFRNIYRLPIVEILLLGCALFQIGSGIFFIKKRWGQRQGFFERLQAISGGYLAFFLLNHVAAVLVSRAYFDLDTNFYFAAAGIHVTPFQYFFIPYYFFAVVAIFSHLACAFHWLSREWLGQGVRDLVGYVMVFLGGVVSLLIVLAMAGGFYPVDIPGKYTAVYGGV